jgi:hypothetical protein
MYINVYSMPKLYNIKSKVLFYYSPTNINERINHNEVIIDDINTENSFIIYKKYINNKNDDKFK